MTDDSSPHGTVEVPVNGRSIVQLLAFVLGGMLSGGGVSYAFSPTEDFREMRNEIREELVDQGKRIERISLDIAGMAASVSQDRRDIIRIEQEINDMRTRLRALETGK